MEPWRRTTCSRPCGVTTFTESLSLPPPSSTGKEPDADARIAWTASADLPHGASKLAGEALISAWVGTFGFRGWIFRFANIVGARTTHGVTYDFVHKLRTDPSRLRSSATDVRRNRTWTSVIVPDAFLHCIETMDDPSTSSISAPSIPARSP